MPNTAIQVKDIQKSYKMKNAVLTGVTFPGERGTIGALFGGNGAGKTTMEACLR